MKTSTAFFGKALKCIGLTISLAICLSASAAVDHTGHSVPATKPAAAICSCCTDVGTWSNALQKVRDFEFEIFDRLQFDNAAHLYLTVASPDDTVGIEFPAGDSDGDHALSVSRQQRRWTFTFKDKGRQVGQLILALPDKATFFKADTNRPPHRRAPVAVYKEVRFEGAVQGTGIFAKGIAPKTKFRLVLQGEGSHCLATEEFYRWNLNVHGPSAGYSFYGFFASPTR